MKSCCASATFKICVLHHPIPRGTGVLPLASNAAISALSKEKKKADLVLQDHQPWKDHCSHTRRAFRGQQLNKL